MALFTLKLAEQDLSSGILEKVKTDSINLNACVSSFTFTLAELTG